MTSSNKKNRTATSSCMQCYCLEDAINARHSGCVRRLLENGKDPNDYIAWRKRILDLCLNEHCPEIVRLLLRHGADPYWYYKDYDIYDLTYVGKAVVRQDLDFLSACIAELPDGVNAQNPADGDTMLHIAAQLNDEKVCEYLIGQGADPLLRNKKGLAPLDIARGGSPVFYLLQHKAQDIRARLADTKAMLQNASAVEVGGGALPPIFAAISSGDEALVEEMLRQGEHAGRSTHDQTTLLHHAAQLGRTGCVRILIKHGAKVNCRNATDETPLHLAAYEDHPETVRVLMQAGANPETFSEGMEDTPLMACRFHKTTRTAQELLRGGADPLTKNTYGFTAMDYARENHNNDLLRLLELYTNKNRF